MKALEAAKLFGASKRVVVKDGKLYCEARRSGMVEGMEKSVLKRHFAEKRYKSGKILIVECEAVDKIIEQTFKDSDTEHGYVPPEI